MKTKLTLSLDKETIMRTKTYSKKSGISVSKLVENYFNLINKNDCRVKSELMPITKSLKGVLAKKASST